MITQTPREFDYPNARWPAQFHYAGPFHDDEGRKTIPFPWEKLTGEPLIYAALGTIVNGLEFVYRIILDAVRTIPGIQVALSVGHNIDLDDLGPIPSNTIVVKSAPQIELLKRAALCITHAGLNTTLESLAQGVPMVAIPIGYDQPGVASRGTIARVRLVHGTPHGKPGQAGLVAGIPGLSSETWGTLRLLSDPAMARRLEKLTPS